MSPFGIGAELDFVDHQTGHRDVLRHGFHGADIETRIFRNDLLFAGDQGDFARAPQADDAVIDLARQKPQRQADHAGLVGQHPFDGKKGLAGVGGPQDGGDFGGEGAAGVQGLAIDLHGCDLCPKRWTGGHGVGNA